MSKFNIQKIEAPKLNVADYGANISTQFNNIDANFQALANSDFFTGARGEGLKLIEVEPKTSDDFEFREDLEFQDESIFEGDPGTDLKNSIIKAFKKYNTSNTTWYVGKKYVLYIDNDKKVHNIYPIIYISETTSVDGNTSQDNSYLDFEYVNGVLTLVRSKGYPSLYYDTDKKKYCWLINGAKTGIVAQGMDGLDGLPGSGHDFDVIIAETNPLTNDGFYKISEVYWPKYHNYQMFYINISSENGTLNGGGSGLSDMDIEWLATGRKQWIDSYGSKTFLVPRTIIEYEKVKNGTGTHKKNEDGTYTQVSEGETGDYIQNQISVLHLCKLIHKTAKHIIWSFDKDAVDGDKDAVDDAAGGIIVDDGAEPKLMSSTTTESKPMSSTTTESKLDTMAPVFSTVVSEDTKVAFEKEYVDNKKFVEQIIAGEVTSIQMVDGDKFVEVSMEGTLGSQIQASVASYADDVYGVYLTNENMYSFTVSDNSLISGTSSTSLALDDVNWANTEERALRCLYLKDCMNAEDHSVPDSGILIYNNTNNVTSGEGNGTLNMRYVGDVSDYNKGVTTADLDKTADPDKTDDSKNSLTLNLGTNGVLKTGALNIGKDLAVGGSTTICGDLDVNDKLSVDGEKVNISGSTEITNSLNVTGPTEITNSLNVTGSTEITNSLNVTGSTEITNDLTVGGQLIGENGKLSINSDLNVTGPTEIAGNLTVRGLTEIAGNLTVKDKLSVDGEKVNISGSTKITNSLNVTGPTTTNSNLTVRGSATMEDDLNVINNLTVDGSTTIANGLTVGTEDNSVNATINGSTKITNDLNVDGSTTTDYLRVASAIRSVPKTIQFVGYSPQAQNYEMISGTTQGQVGPGNRPGIDDGIDLEQKLDIAIDDILNPVDNGYQVIIPGNGNTGGSSDDTHAVDIDSMILINIPGILFNLISSLYTSKSIGNIESYNNTTWVGKNFELKIKYIGMHDSYIYYYTTGYIEFFNGTINNDGSLPHNINKLNIDTPVRMKVSVNDNVITTHDDLSLKIYNNDGLEWGNSNIIALPYICVYPGSGYTDKTKYWDIPTSSKYDYFHLAKGRVNISSLNGPYLIDTYDAKNTTLIKYYMDRDMHSDWITTTYYPDPNA